MNIAVLGSGPAALFAAHAALLGQHNVRIISSKGKSSLPGGQYMLNPVPGLSVNSDRLMIDLSLFGSIETYKRKAGHDKQLVFSGDLPMFGDIQGWSLYQAYERAWLQYGRLVEKSKEVPSEVYRWADLVVSSIPAWLICEDDDHIFRHQVVYTTDYVKPIGSFAGNQMQNLVVCSGAESDWWYRMSRVEGFELTEYTAENHPDGAKEVEIPYGTNCGCRPDIFRVGRSGKYDAEVRPESAYYDVIGLIEQQEIINQMEEE